MATKTYTVRGQKITVFDLADRSPSDAIPVWIDGDLVAMVEKIPGPDLASAMDSRRMADAAMRHTGAKIIGWRRDPMSLQYALHLTSKGKDHA